MVKERKAIGQKAMVGHPIRHKAMVWPPLAKAIAQATGIKTWPEDCQTRNAEKILNNGSWKKEISNVPGILRRVQRASGMVKRPFLSDMD